MFQACLDEGLPIDEAVNSAAEAYLDGRPARRSKHKINQAERDETFWLNKFLFELPDSAYSTDAFVLALSRYMRQEKFSHFELLHRVAARTPEVVRRAARYSGLVLRQESQRWKEVEQIGLVMSAEFGEFIRICHTFDRAHRDRNVLVETCRKPLASLSPLELLSYASLYAFEHLVPKLQSQDDHAASPENDFQPVSEAINDILLWKIETSTDHAFHLTDSIIGASLRDHLSPFLFPSPNGSPVREDLFRAFGHLVAAQLELNYFMSQSVDAFCYDDSISFEFQNQGLAIVERDPAAREAWQRNGDKLARLHTYWFYRAVDAFAASELATAHIGSPENHEMNQLAYIKAIRTQLQLTEVYGLDKSVTTDSGLRVDLFQATLSMELMSAFYINDFVRPYIEHLRNTGNWRSALTLLAMGGLIQPGSQIRFPLTWSEQEAKIKSIRPWTVSKDFSQGNAKAAEAILDFWTNDLRAVSSRLRTGESCFKTPEFYERPVLKLGRYLFQLPWMVAMQNNTSAAINNLRRIGARRAESRDETRRIEHRLAEQFEARGFKVRVGYQPVRTSEDDPGEVDLICAKDGHLFVMEIKSTFLRKTLKEAWLHKTVTLRKAGLQLRRKTEAVIAAVHSDDELAHALDIAHWRMPPILHGWIIDTSLEHDHETFAGFLKVSLEEILIALRDDRDLLNDPEDWFKRQTETESADPDHMGPSSSTLYPNGFSCGHFVDVIKLQVVWKT
jgi:hypothetical protein